MKRLSILGLLLVPMLAFAEPKTAEEWYKEGETQYNLGNFEKAADAFKQGFALETSASKRPAYLYNVGQAYRQANKCKDALFFYKRYLSLKDQDPSKPLSKERRDEVEGFITTLEACVKEQDAVANKQPDTIENTGSGAGNGSASAPAGTGSGSGTRVAAGGGDDDGDDGDDSGITKGTTVEAAKLVDARFVLGGAKVLAGSLNTSIQPSFALTAGYPLPVHVPKLTLDAGATFGMTPVTYTNAVTAEKKVASLVQTLANIGATYEVAPKISVRGDLGLGVLFMGGIQEMGSPFTEGGAATTGTLTMFAVRVAASAEYLFSPNFFGSVMPLSFSYSPPKSGLRSDIKAMSQLDFMIGVGYRM